MGMVCVQLETRKLKFDMTHKQLEHANVVFNRSSLRKVIKKTSKRPKTELEKLRAKAKRDRRENQFLFIWKAINGPELVREHKFADNRKWRFDFAHKDTRVAIEIEGGTWGKSRHTTGSGYAEDREKYNTAQELGWKVFCLTSDKITANQAERIMAVIKTELGRLEP